MAERYTRADVARKLEHVNAQAGRLGMAGAGSYAVETMGGDHLYLTDRSRLESGHTGPGARLVELGKSWHAAWLKLHEIQEAWHLVEFLRAEARVTD